MVECGVCWFARSRRRLGGRGGRRAGRARASRTSGSIPTAGARPVPVVRSRAASPSSCSSPRPACCAPSAPPGRSRARPQAHGATRAAGPRARRTDAGRGSTTGACSRRTRSCGPAGRGSGVCLLTSWTIASTRQELFFFAGGPAWRTPGVPAYVDFEGAIYGTGDLDGLGVKAAPDLDGPPLDPDAALPAASAAGEARAREFLRERFPALADGPARRARSAAATSSRPTRTSWPRGIRSTRAVWLYGGGSGHGFKHGPALAEQMAAALAGTDGAAGALRAGPSHPGALAAHRGRESPGNEPRRGTVLAPDDGLFPLERSPRLMKLPSRRTRIALLAGCATFAAAAPASATVTSTYSTDPDATLTVNSDGADAITITCDNGFTKVNGARSGPRLPSSPARPPPAAPARKRSS